ncbi:hypothetical protein LAWI1_G004457 [Lachnellula willkommii]|uniref:Uncharacterized protein n=1 Tax=Lachnellula willkommii TaxID=215461 RepID=A0A559M4V8_9HELO|nr:hypothetical protein LAWI1_G004457 [Lachnellula willkommii]
MRHTLGFPTFPCPIYALSRRATPIGPDTIVRMSDYLNYNVKTLAEDVRGIMAWGVENKIFFALEKLEIIYLTKKRTDYNPPYILRVYFNRAISFKRHVVEYIVAYHICGLAWTAHGPLALALRKAVITCVLPSLLYSTEETISARIGGLIDTINKTLTLAARGVLLVWRTTPIVMLFRDAGLLSAAAALKEAKLQFIMRLKTINPDYPLAEELAYYNARKLKIDLTGGTDKKEAATRFMSWLKTLGPDDILVYSDGLEQYDKGTKFVGYRYLIHQNNR